MSYFWIKVDTTLPMDGRISRVAMRLGTDRARALGALVMMWVMVDAKADADDFVAGLTPEDIDAHVGVPGFAAALPPDWLTVEDGGCRFPGYTKRNGSTSRARTMAAALHARGPR